MHRDAAIIPRAVGDFVKPVGKFAAGGGPLVRKIRNHAGK